MRRSSKAKIASSKKLAQTGPQEECGLGWRQGVAGELAGDGPMPVPSGRHRRQTAIALVLDCAIRRPVRTLLSQKA